MCVREDVCEIVCFYFKIIHVRQKKYLPQIMMGNWKLQQQEKYMEERSWRQRWNFPFRFDFEMAAGEEGDGNYLMTRQHFRRKEHRGHFKMSTPHFRRWQEISAWRVSATEISSSLWMDPEMRGKENVKLVTDSSGQWGDCAERASNLE